MALTEVLDRLTQKINQSRSESLTTVYGFIVKDRAEMYQLRIDSGQASWSQGTTDDARCTLEMTEDNFLKLSQGALNPTMAFMTGKLKVHGDMGLALQLQSFF